MLERFDTLSTIQSEGESMPRYYVSGIIQIEVVAKNEVEAGEKALARAQQLMKQSPTLNIGIEIETTELK